MSLKIYGRKSSPNVQKICWICEEAQIEFETNNVGGIYGGLNTKKFKKLNPNSTFPVMNDGGFILYESNSIIKYISEKYSIFKTINLRQTSITNQWIDWSSLTLGLQCAIYRAYCNNLPNKLIDNRQFKKDDMAANKARKKINSLFEILNKQLLLNEFIINNKLGLADISIGCWLHRCRLLELDISEYRGIEKWLLKLDERKAFQLAVISAPLPPN